MYAYVITADIDCDLVTDPCPDIYDGLDEPTANFLNGCVITTHIFMWM